MINIRKKARIRNAFDIMGNQAKDIAIMNGHLNIIKKSVAQDLRGHDKKGMTPGQHFANNPEKPTKEDFQKYGSKIVGKQIKAFEKINEAIDMNLVDIQNIGTKAFSSKSVFIEDYVHVLKTTLGSMKIEINDLIAVLNEEKELLDNTGLFAVRFREFYGQELEIYGNLHYILEINNKHVIQIKDWLEKNRLKSDGSYTDSIRSIAAVVTGCLTYAVIALGVMSLFDSGSEDMAFWQQLILSIGTVVSGSIYGSYFQKILRLEKTFKIVDNELQFPEETMTYYPKLVKDFSANFSFN